MLRKNVAAALIIKGTLKTAVYSANRDDIRLVEVWDGVEVLAVAVFDDEIQSPVVRVHWKSDSSAPVPARIPAQEVKPVFTNRGHI
jgi:hypothetical protein